MEEHLWKRKMPKLHIKWRISLYVAMVLFVILLLADDIFNIVSFHMGIIIYLIGACILAAGMYYLIFDLKYGMQIRIKLRDVEDSYVNELTSNHKIQKVVRVVPGAMSNIIFASFNGVMGIISRSFWFGSLAVYYILLTIMRIDIIKEKKVLTGISNEERREREMAIYRKNSIYFIVMVVVLGGMLILLELAQGKSYFPGFILCAVAVYSVYKIIRTSVNVVRIRRQQSPLLSLIVKIGYIDACVSILVLQNALFCSFIAEQTRFVKIMNRITGIAVCFMVLLVGVRGLWITRKQAQISNYEEGDDIET